MEHWRCRYKMKDTIYSKRLAKALDRQAQMKILRERGIKFNARSREDALVKLIVDSNSTKDKIPKTDKKIDYACPTCGSQMIITGGGHSGTDFKCSGCGLNLTKVI